MRAIASMTLILLEQMIVAELVVSNNDDAKKDTQRAIQITGKTIQRLILCSCLSAVSLIS